MYSLSMMQSVFSKLVAGFEMFYIPMQNQLQFCYGACLNHDIHTFYANYMPLQRKEAIQFGYVARPSRRLTLFGEYKGSQEGHSDTLFGFRMKFAEGQV